MQTHSLSDDVTTQIARRPLGLANSIGAGVVQDVGSSSSPSNIPTSPVGVDVRGRSVGNPAGPKSFGWQPHILRRFRVALVQIKSRTPAWQALTEDEQRAAAAAILNFFGPHGKGLVPHGELKQCLPTGTGRGRRSSTGYVTEKTAGKRLNRACEANVFRDPISTTHGFGRGANVYAALRHEIREAWALVYAWVKGEVTDFTERLKKSLSSLQRKVQPAYGNGRKRGQGRLAGAPRASSDDVMALLEGREPCGECSRRPVYLGRCLDCLASAGKPTAPCVSRYLDIPNEAQAPELPGPGARSARSDGRAPLLSRLRRWLKWLKSPLGKVAGRVEVTA